MCGGISMHIGVWQTNVETLIVSISLSEERRRNESLKRDNVKQLYNWIDMENLGLISLNEDPLTDKDGGNLRTHLVRSVIFIVNKN